MSQTRYRSLCKGKRVKTRTNVPEFGDAKSPLEPSEPIAEKIDLPEKTKSKQLYTKRI